MSMLTSWLESLAYEIEPTGECLHSYTTKSSCTACMDACPATAISIINGKPAISEERCDKCGFCIPVCPQTAIHGRSPERAIYRDALIIGDGEKPTVQELLYFYKKGIRSMPIKQDDHAALITANKILQDMNLAPYGETDFAAFQNDIPSYSRRGFFQKIAWDGKKFAASSITPAKWRFNHDSFSMAGMFEDYSLYKTAIDTESCTLCEACFKLCPKNIFSVEEGALKMNQILCNGCSLCVDLCSVNAISVTLKASPAVVETLDIQSSTCSGCSSRFHQWTEQTSILCPVCSDRKSKGYLSPYG